MSASGNDEAKLKGIVAGTLASLALGLTAGLVAALGFWPWPAEVGESALASMWNFAGVLTSGLVTGGTIGLLMGASLAWHGGNLGSTLDRGDAAPLFGVLTGIVLAGSLSPLIGGVLGLFFGQLLGGALLGLVLGPLVGITGWEIGYWTADFYRGMQRAH